MSICKNIAIKWKNNKQTDRQSKDYKRPPHRRTGWIARVERSKQYYLGTYDGKLKKYREQNDSRNYNRRQGTYSGTFYGNKENEDNLENDDKTTNLDLPDKHEVEADDLNEISNIVPHKLLRNQCQEFHCRRSYTSNTSILLYFHSYFHTSILLYFHFILPLLPRIHTSILHFESYILISILNIPFHTLTLQSYSSNL